MPRQVRIEYPGAVYHVMARGDRLEPIVSDDEDRKTFVRTLAKACQRAGFRLHAYVLMPNHYHLLLETPQANLSRGMAWLQNAYTRRINTRHRLWGHVFGGRYKAIPIEPGECFGAVLDYIHLNPVRAGLIGPEESLQSYPWSSLPAYLTTPARRPEWLQTELGFRASGCKDNTAGREQFLENLQRRVDWNNAADAGAKPLEETAEASVSSTLRRGWYLGSDDFRTELLQRFSKQVEGRKIKAADGYNGPEWKDHGETRAAQLLAAGLEHFGLSLEELQRCRKGDPRKILLAGLIQAETTVRLDWITEQLRMGTRSACCRLIASGRAATTDARQVKTQRAILKNINMK